ncbi:triose-phosphate transporter family-domain-containing protein [Phlebopus sp. FC_14]|nr:triose-phosphate transporter family-domain-containing protein [Phlebopus sp. FC_14]
MKKQISPPGYRGDYENSLWNNSSNGHHLNLGNTWPATFPFSRSLPPRQHIQSPLAFATGLSSYSPYTILANVKAFLHRSCSSEMLVFPSSISHHTHRPLTSMPQSSTASALRFTFLCIVWYTTSALSSNTGKAILTQFSYPVTLTIIQFGIVAAYCLLFMTPAIGFSKLRPSNGAILRATLPMGAFQVGGHMFSSMAISRIPVATVHTIKALSPLFTVAAYALLFGVKYSPKTYVSLLPLTVGVMLACTFDVSASSPMGLLCAFGSALVFVSSNIFFKKVMPSGTQTSSHKLDKLNLLLYSSGTAFILMIPLWSFTDLPGLLAVLDDSTHVVHPSHSHVSSYSLTYHFILNGTVHFAQNIIAFVILSSTSPVTYSIASLVKRVWVICMAIVWFNQSVHPIQGLGIGMTFTGLYMYNAAKGDVERGENKMRRVEAARDMILPSTRAEEKLLNGSVPSSPLITDPHMPVASTTGMGSRSQHPTATANARFQVPNVLGYPQPPNLRINIIPPEPSVFTKRGGVLPTQPYPSPPASLDSPPSHSVPLGCPLTVYSTHAEAFSHFSSEPMRAAQVTA